MSETKTLKVSEEIHERLSARADRMGMKLGRLAEALLSAGLELSDRKVLDEVASLLDQERPE